MNLEKGNLHISKDKNRGYIEYDPYLELSNGKKLHGKHGLMEIRAEIAREACDAGMINNPAIKDFLRDK